MLAPGRIASRARATEGAVAKSARTAHPTIAFNNIRQYMSYKIAMLCSGMQAFYSTFNSHLPTRLD